MVTFQAASLYRGAHRASIEQAVRFAAGRNHTSSSPEVERQPWVVYASGDAERAKHLHAAYQRMDNVLSLPFTAVGETGWDILASLYRLSLKAGSGHGPDARWAATETALAEWYGADTRKVVQFVRNHLATNTRESGPDYSEEVLGQPLMVFKAGVAEEDTMGPRYYVPEFGREALRRHFGDDVVQRWEKGQPVRDAVEHFVRRLKTAHAR